MGQSDVDPVYRASKMIRQFKPEDAQACLEVICDCIRQDGTLSTPLRDQLVRAETAESIAERARLYYLAVWEKDDCVVGLAGLDMNEIRLLFVAPDHQGQGIGRELLQYLESMVPPAMFSDIFVYSTLAAERFYRAHGYQSRGEQVFDIHGQPLRTIFMVKRLHP
ncbi:MAG: GNAT family N-acetyltransferase [Acidobacteria bacterium]|nr:GNAT family N-acetyltransferase [Acidobacteriota bacterium]